MPMHLWHRDSCPVSFLARLVTSTHALASPHEQDTIKFIFVCLWETQPCAVLYAWFAAAPSAPSLVPRYSGSSTAPASWSYVERVYGEPTGAPIIQPWYIKVLSKLEVGMRKCCTHYRLATVVRQTSLFSWTGNFHEQHRIMVMRRSHLLIHSFRTQPPHWNMVWKVLGIPTFPFWLLSLWYSRPVYCYRPYRVERALQNFLCMHSPICHPLVERLNTYLYTWPHVRLTGQY